MISPKKIRVTNIFKLLLLFTFSLVMNNGWANAVQKSVQNYQEIEEIVTSAGSPSQTLVVLDDDDTLTMMPCPNSQDPKTCQYIGGPAWFDWQASLPDTSVDRVASSFDGLLQVNNLLFNLTEMPYTEEDVPTVLNQLSSKGVKLLVETARAPDAAEATANQLEALSVTDEMSFLSLIDNSALKGASGLSSLPTPFLPCDIENARSVGYQQGVFYVSGQDKGEMLHCLLSKTDSEQIKNIVFIDDTQKNVDNVYQSFSNDENYNVIAIHYTALDDHKEAFTSGAMSTQYQQAAKNRWKVIKSAMQISFIEPALPESCDIQGLCFHNGSVAG